MVVVHFPPPLRSVAPKFVTLNRNDELLRIFDPTKYDAICEAVSFRTATSFRDYGPVSRFDHHQEYPNKIDLDRSVIYAAPTLSCCLVEIFGDGGIIKIEQQQLALITLNDTFKLLDLKGAAAMAAGTVAALSSITERNISQAWGRYFYENSQLYGEIDGLIFAGAHNGEDAVCLYERAESKLASTKVEILNLNHPDLRDTILSIAKNHSLIVSPY
ncbi:MAG: hypothetical protein RLZZ04_4850 [Cyanobacteriota bacterium]|jgi:hypothetical protein